MVQAAAREQPLAVNKKTPVDNILVIFNQFMVKIYGQKELLSPHLHIISQK